MVLFIQRSDAPQLSLQEQEAYKFADNLIEKMTLREKIGQLQQFTTRTAAITGPDGVKRDTSKMRLLLRSLARNESTTVTNKTLTKDIKAVDDEDIDSNTVSAYLDIFKRLFITDNQPPFSSGIRSSVRIKQAGGREDRG